MSKPTPFLEVVVKELDLTPVLFALDAGYEQGNWRADGLAAHLIEWLPEFALSEEEYNSISGVNAIRMVIDAAARVYTTDKYGKRGEFGELLLHIALRQEFDSVPVISKYFHKSSANETVKGFDTVHVLGDPEAPELWLGEAKLYESANAAIGSVAQELIDHSAAEYLKSEFSTVARKIDADSKYGAGLLKLLDKNTSLDEVFSSLKFAVLLTYNSAVICANSEKNEAFLTEIEAEVLSHHKLFAEKTAGLDMSIVLFLVPLGDLKKLRALLDKRLKSAQEMG